MHGDVGMKVVLAQAEPHAKITEGFCPFTALRHGSCGLPLGRGAHFQNTIPSTAHDGVLKVAAETEEALQKYPEQSFAQKFGLCNR